MEKDQDLSLICDLSLLIFPLILGSLHARRKIRTSIIMDALSAGEISLISLQHLV